MSVADPVLHLLAGPNGAGKTTLFTEIIEPATGLVWVNADDIAAELDAADPETAYVASRMASDRRRELMAQRRSFATETVFSHPSKIDLVRKADELGYLVTLHVVLVPEALAVARVRNRVETGGHDVPEEKVRARYRRVLRQRVLFYKLIPPDTDLSVSDRVSFVDELVARIEAAIHPDEAPVRARKRQDRPDDDFLRMTPQQAQELLSAPGMDTLLGVRDTAMIALFLCTGIRAAELAALQMEDLYQRLGGELALHVREGKGCKERLVPYGALAWCLDYVEAWRGVARIESGPLFDLTVRAVQYRIGKYPVTVDGRRRQVRLHDLRRTYARWLYVSGVDVQAIAANLGHTDTKVTYGYIGDPDVAERVPPPVFKG